MKYPLGFKMLTVVNPVQAVAFKYITSDFVPHKMTAVSGKEATTRDMIAISQVHRVLPLMPSAALPQLNRQITATAAAGFISMPSHKTASCTPAAPYSIRLLA
jgi:hypothetical protein